MTNLSTTCALHGALALVLTLTSACSDTLIDADPPRLHDLAGAPEFVREAAKAVVRIQHPAGAAGTGSFISPDGLLLTNNHVLGGEACAREGCVVKLSFQHQLGTLGLSPRTLFAVPQHVDVGLDMAVLQIYLDETREEPLPSKYFLTLAPRSSAELIGEHVTAVGHPLGRLKKWSDGFVVRAEGEWFETTIFSLPGGSGSPILNDAGELVGLLHRGVEGFDLITETSTQVSAIASAGAEIERALAEELPDSVLSLDDSLSPAQAMAHSDAFLAASRWSANVDGEQTTLVSLFGAACDESLARDDYGAIEQLQSELWPCFAALDFIECRSDVGEELADVPKQCPLDREAWQARLVAVNDKQRAFNGSLELSAISYSLEGLAGTQREAEATARENLRVALDAQDAPVDLATASYLAAYGVDSQGEQDVLALIVDYREQPFYERYAWEIAISALWYYSADLLDGKLAVKIAKDLYRDDNVSLGAKLRIEEVLYNSDEL